MYREKPSMAQTWSIPQAVSFHSDPCVTYDLSILLYMDADLFESQYLSGEGNDICPEANVPLAVISK